jgi:tight adherence protein B
LSAADDNSNPTKLVKERVLSDMPRMQRVLQTMPRAHQLDRFIVQSGLDWTVSGLLLGSAILFALGMLTTIIAANPWSWACFQFGAGVPFHGCFCNAKTAAPETYGAPTPRSAGPIARALRAGHAFSASLQMAGEELPNLSPTSSAWCMTRSTMAHRYSRP